MFGVILLFAFSQMRLNGRFPHGMLAPSPQRESELDSPELEKSLPLRNMTGVKYFLAIECMLLEIAVIGIVVMLVIQWRQSDLIRDAQQFVPGRGPELHVSELGLYDDSGITSAISRLSCAENPIYCGESIFCRVKTNSLGLRNNTQHIYAFAIENVGTWKSNWVDVFIHLVDDYRAGVIAQAGN